MKTYHILNLGAGVQSTALYLMSMRRDEPEHVPLFDYAIFADTQEEPKAVYEHLQWLKSLGGPPIIEATAGKLGDDLINGFPRKKPGKTAVGFKQLPAFQSTHPGILEGKAPRHCTGHYKIGVVEQTIRRNVLGVEPRCHIPDDVRVHQYFGLSYDEAKRIVKVQDRFRKSTYAKPHFPLWDMQMVRNDCAAYLAPLVPHTTPRSACTFCPFRRNQAWRDMRDNDADGWRRALEIDMALRNGAACSVGLETSLYLHRDCVPLAKADIDRPESPLDEHLFGFAQECEGVCGL